MADGAAGRAEDRHVVLLGLMASGKSTVGRVLARRLGRRLVDNDVQLEAMIGRTAVQHADRFGMGELHVLEADVLRQSLASSPPAVVTAAASVGDRPDLAELVAGHHVVWLDVDPVVLAARVPPEGDHRPLDDAALASLRQQRQRRAPAFRAVADVVLTWSDEGPEELADRVLRQLGLDGQG